MIMCILHMSRVCIKNYSRSVYVIHHGRYPDIKKQHTREGLTSCQHLFVFIRLMMSDWRLNVLIQP